MLLCWKLPSFSTMFLKGLVNLSLESFSEAGDGETEGWEDKEADPCQSDFVPAESDECGV